MEIVFASQNKNKINEITAILSGKRVVIGLDALKNEIFNDELPETGNTLEANALQKARFVYENSGKPCFADDTGLEISCLDGRPGVYSARYAGETKNASDNIAKILSEMKDCQERKARFRTVIAFVDGKTEKLFEGIVEGTITSETRGNSGFGYDPIFVPEAFSETFAEMDAAEKNKVSHRKRAISKFIGFLDEYC